MLENKNDNAITVEYNVLFKNNLSAFYFIYTLITHNYSFIYVTIIINKFIFVTMVLIN